MIIIFIEKLMLVMYNFNLLQLLYIFFLFLCKMKVSFVVWSRMFRSVPRQKQLKKEIKEIGLD